MQLRFEPTLTPGQPWRVDICTGNRKRGTFRAAPCTEPIYTLAQARTFARNNNPRDFAHLLRSDT